MTATATPALPQAPRRAARPILHMVRRRSVMGVLTLFLASIVVFVATEILPGNAAEAILGRNDTSAKRLHADAELGRSRILGCCH